MEKMKGGERVKRPMGAEGLKTRAGIASESEQVHDPTKSIFGLRVQGREILK